MTPQWIIYLLGTLVAVLISLSFLLYTDKSRYVMISIVLTIGVVIVICVLYQNNEQFKLEEKKAKDRETVSGIDVVDMLPDDLPEQNAKNKSTLKSKLVGGVVFCGRRHNLIKKDWFKEYFKREIITIIDKSRLGMSEEYKLTIPAKGKAKIHFIGTPKATRKDYIFSTYCYSDNNNFKDIGLSISISNGKNESTKNAFSFIDSNIQMIQTRTKQEVYRPSVAQLFASVPKKIKATLEISNNSLNNFDIFLSIPSIEEGLHTTEGIILPGESLGNGYWTFPRRDNFFTKPQGVLTMVVQPFFKPNELTPGINPIYLHCVAEDKSNGIEIYCDSKDNGRLKAKIINDNKIDIIESDVAFFKPNIYGISLRWSENQIDLLVNGKNISTLKGKTVPTDKSLPDAIYIASAPLGVEHSAYSLIGNFNPLPQSSQAIPFFIHQNWIDNEEIKQFLKDTFPHAFN